jgi:hypothetical protein
MTYFMIDHGGGPYLICMVTRRVPYLLHHLKRLLDRHVPRVCGLSDEGHICRDKSMPEPCWRDIVRKLLNLSLFRRRFTGLDLNYNVLDWG